eukprot:gene14085-18903_t
MTVIVEELLTSTSEDGKGEVLSGLSSQSSDNENESPKTGYQLLVDFSKRLKLCLMIYESTSTIGGKEQQLNESDLNFVQNSIDEIDLYLMNNSEKYKDLVNESNWNAQIPVHLFLSDMPGAVARDKINFISGFSVRGPNYVKDHKKIPSPHPLFYLRGIQIVEKASFQHNVALEPWCGFPKFKQTNEWLIVNIMVPGSSCVHVVCLFSASAEAHEFLTNFNNLNYHFNNQNNHSAIPTTSTTPSHSTTHSQQTSLKQSSSDTGSNGGDLSSTVSLSSLMDTPWKRCLGSFWNGNQEFCDSRFKMIPSVIDGNWTIKMAVGQKPALTGKKLTHSYFKGQNYMEVDIDISSSSVAKGILGM